MYQNTLREGIILGRHIWDSLLEVDPDTGDLMPSLAKSYKWIDDTTIEFELRDDVVFHNGQKFTADDVVHTMNFVSDEKNVTSISRVIFIAGAEKVDPYKVHVKLKHPFPAAMQYLASVVVIYPHAHHSKLDKQGMATEPVGTGPYKVTEVSYGSRIVLEKLDGYMKDGPKTPSIGKLVFRQIEERGTQLAELLSGGADWLWRIQPDIAKKLEEKALSDDYFVQR
jgi:peptide/nickel transport system substrate-binding protein